MDEDIYPDELYHYGRKGMKWGQNIFGRPRSSGTKKKKKSVGDSLKEAYSQHRQKKQAKRQAETENRARQSRRKKKVSEMTDDELRSEIARLELEKRYRDLSPQETHRGRQFVMDILEKSARNIGEQTLTYAFGTLANRVGNAAGVQGDMVNPKKGQKDKK